MKPRNILTNLEETLLAMSAVEDRGNYYGKTQRVGYTVGEALIECNGRSVMPDYFSQEDWDEMQDGIGTIVYGADGWNRWGVKYNGEVLFSRHHAREGDIKLAESYGFKTW